MTDFNRRAFGWVCRMAERKNQHFVPRVLLRPFTKNAEGKSINLYNIRADRSIPDAPVKGQCASNYWYGEDGELEALLGKLEGMFGAARARITGGSNSDKDYDEVHLFMCFQHYRTAQFAASYKHSIQQMRAASWAPEPKEIPEDKKLVTGAMRFAIKARRLLTDLKIRFVENRTRRDFIVGDAPAVLLNRFAFERLEGAAWGVASSGVIFVMPLSPRLSAIAYDSQVYTLDAVDRRVILKSQSAVDAYNDIQCILAHENVYFRQWDDGEYVRQRIAAVKEKRRAPSIARTFVPDGENDIAEHYKPGTKEEGEKAKRSLIAVQFNHPEHDRWIPGLRYRSKPVAFSNGSGVGHVRKPEWLRADPNDTRSRGRQREKRQIIRTARPREV